MPTKTRWTKAAAGNRWSVFVSESAPQLRLKYSITLIAEDENILRERVSELSDRYNEQTVSVETLLSRLRLYLINRPHR